MRAISDKSSAKPISESRGTKLKCKTPPQKHQGLLQMSLPQPVACRRFAHVNHSNLQVDQPILRKRQDVLFTRRGHNNQRPLLTNPSQYHVSPLLQVSVSSTGTKLPMTYIPFFPPAHPSAKVDLCSACP